MILKRLIAVIILGCCSLIPLIAQNQANIWYFGLNAGLDFNNGAPVALTDGAMNTKEGCSSIADENGNLLFYTDGSTVWDQLHQIMPNGMDLSGHFSSTQSALIVAQPGSDNLYYIFTTTYQAKQNGLRYSRVDLSLNGGLGDVIDKNIPLFTPSTEKLTAVAHANGEDVWVIGHEWNSSSFRAYLINEQGINNTPITSSVGFIHMGGDSNSNAGGQMKASPNGEYIALVLGQAVGVPKTVEVFNFDAATGVLSLFFFDNDFEEFPPIYGLEFSENSTVLYASELPPNPEFESSIFQYDLSLSTPDEIIASKSIIATTTSSGALQLGPDGKIYLARVAQDQLGVINQPNELGVLSEYSENGPRLSSGQSRFGLPGYVQSLFQPPEAVLIMPNVFTPNDDNTNSHFIPTSSLNIRSARLSIINRWGKIIFETENLGSGWDGSINNQPASTGVYYWLVKFEGVNGEQGSQKGWLHLLR